MAVIATPIPVPSIAEVAGSLHTMPQPTSCSKITSRRRWWVGTGMSDDQALDPDDDTLPPEHPAGSDAPVSAGEALSGEGIGTGRSGPAPADPAEPNADRLPDDDT